MVPLCIVKLERPALETPANLVIPQAMTHTHTLSDTRDTHAHTNLHPFCLHIRDIGAELVPVYYSLIYVEGCTVWLIRHSSR